MYVTVESESDKRLMKIPIDRKLKILYLLSKIFRIFP